VGWVLEIRFWVDGLGVRVSGLGWVWVVDIRWCGGWVGVGLVRVMLLHIPLKSKPVDIRRGGGWVGFVFVTPGTCIPGATLHLHWNASAEWLQITAAGLFEPASGFKSMSTSKAGKAE
jgi:hypothetical protein